MLNMPTQLHCRAHLVHYVPNQSRSNLCNQMKVNSMTCIYSEPFSYINKKLQLGQKINQKTLNVSICALNMYNM